MTQTAATMFRVLGKDRLSDHWAPFEARFRWQAENWAAQRAFIGEVIEVPVTGRARIEWITDGVWQPYTAWEGPEARARQIEWIEKQRASGSVQTFRIGVEDQPRTIVGI
jgi:hypothetical protein